MLKAYKESSDLVTEDKPFHYDEKIGSELLNMFLNANYFDQIFNKHEFINRLLSQNSNLLNFIITFYRNNKNILPHDFQFLEINLNFMNDLLFLIKGNEIVLDTITTFNLLYLKYPSKEIRKITITNSQFPPSDTLDFTFGKMETLVFRNCTVTEGQILKDPITQLIIE